MSCPILLVDGSSYFFRAYHALPPLTTAHGLQTGAIFGVANMIKRLIKDYQPQHMAVVFDAKGRTFRDELFPAYKAHRPPMPVELSSQFPLLIDLLKAMGLPILIEEGVEADDVIGTLAREATDAGLPVLISTGDKDMAQLVNKHVNLINTMTNQRLNEEGVKEKFGVTPAQIIDYLTLIGDTSDNVPGVHKCGPKTAVKWLTEYQTLDGIIANAACIAGKVGESLRMQIPQLALSKQLVTIDTHLTLPLAINELTIQQEDCAKLIALTQELEFKSWLKELENKPASNNNTSIKINFELITTQEQLDTLMQQLKTATLIALDTETTDLDAINAEIVGISCAITPDKPVYIPLAHANIPEQLDRAAVLTTLKPILELASIAKVGQNLKYDYTVFKNHGITLQGIKYDTMLESYLIQSAGRHSLDALALKYLNYTTISFKDIAGSGKDQLRFNKIPLEIAAPYAAEDADIALKLHNTLYPMLDEKLRSVLHEIEMPLLTVLAEMERAGVLIDEKALVLHGARLRQQINILEQEAYNAAGREFNLNSPKQLLELLYDEQKLPILAKTPKGQPSTAEHVLQELSHNYRLPAVILEYRSLSKLVSTYIDALPKCINQKTGRVHTSYNQAVTATGRLSSSAPNLQNIPIRTEEGRLVRTAFIAPPEHVLLTADYSQIELRIMAHLSQDHNLLTSFAHNLDIHSATAAEIFNVELIDVTAEQRRRAKAVNFGLIYGMSAFGLAKQLDIDRKDAQHYVEMYFARYPGVATYMENTRALAHAQGYVETLFGRRLYLPLIDSKNMMQRKAAERTAINAPLQGTAADIIKKSMIAIHAFLQQNPQLGTKMIMQVHDELVFEVPKDNIAIINATVQEKMEHVVQLSVPLLVSIGIGRNWDEAH